MKGFHYTKYTLYICRWWLRLAGKSLTANIAWRNLSPEVVCLHTSNHTKQIPNCTSAQFQNAATRRLIPAICFDTGEWCMKGKENFNAKYAQSISDTSGCAMLTSKMNIISGKKWNAEHAKSHSAEKASNSAQENMRRGVRWKAQM